MTESPVASRCGWCGRGLPERRGPGRPRRFCQQACRQAAYVAGQRRAELGLSETELVITRRALDELRDQLYVLEAAVEDVERDLSNGETAQDLRDAVDWLLAAARPLAQQGHDLT
jgi:hypothetical protein